MARETERPSAGTIRFGSRRKGVQGEVHIETTATANKPALLALDAVSPSDGSVTTYYLWVDSAGKLRISSAKPTTEVSDGTIVGSQS